jgi:hypothetical protein
MEAAMKMMSVVCALCLAILACPVAAQEKITRSLNLTEGSYADIRQTILMHPPKQQWRKIPWRPNLAEAIVEAREMDKPILLWMMNGHPCGMT